MLIKYNSSLFDPFYGVIDFLDKDLTSSFKLFDTMRSGQIGITGDNIPKMNIYFDEADNKFIIKTVLAGFNKKDVKVFIKRGCLNVEYQSEKSEKTKDVVREISNSSFKRKVAIPDNVDIDSAQSSYEDGVLTIKFNLKEEKVKEITF